jgi:hypothetical protein
VALGYEQSGNGSHTKRIVDIDPSLRQMRFGASEAGKRHPQVGNQLDPLIMWAEGREDEAVDPFRADKLLDLREWVTRRGTVRSWNVQPGAFR